ncbi:MAG: alpha/beta fold hydrolase [Anaerolineae bacterium]
MKKPGASLVNSRRNNAMEATVNGTTLYYETVGQGTPMFIMHGGLGMDHTYFRPWLDQLADQMTLVYYDHRANGRSERPVSLDGVDHATWAADADALREHLGYDQIILLGHSYGGFLAQEYAIRYGDRLKGLVLSCTAPTMDYGEVILANAQARGTQEQLEALGGLLSRPMADDDEMGAHLGAVLPLYFHRPDPAVIEDVAERGVYSAAAWNHAAATCMPVFNYLASLSDITAPTLVLSGDDDYITPPAQGGARIHAAIPGSEFVVFEHSGHFPFIEETDRFMEVMRAWLAERQ